MPSNCCGKQRHQQLRPPPLINHRDNTKTYGEPHHRNRHDFHMQWDGMILPEIPDINAQSRVIYQPLIQLRRAAHKEPCREQQQWRSRHHRQKNSRYTQAQREQSKYG